jgi:hypothetical protein
MIRDDIILSSGRTVRHTPAPNGAQYADPTTGPEDLTEAEWEEYCAIIRQANRPKA